MPRVLSYNITVEQYNGYIRKTKHSLLLPPTDEENQAIQYLLQDLKADFRYRVNVTVALKSDPNKELQLITESFVYDFMTGRLRRITVCRIIVIVKLDLALQVFF